MKITYNQLLILAIILGVGWSFTVGMAYHSMFISHSKERQQANLISEISKENRALKIEVNGLIELMKIKDNQFIGHYTHTEVKSDFRIVNRR